MTPQEKLKEIKQHYIKLPFAISSADYGWLISRVEQLEGALEHYADPTQFVDRGLGVTDEREALVALSTGPKPE